MPIRPPTARLIPQLRRSALAADPSHTDGQLLAEFVRCSDPDAFAALVRRHGPMVLGVCRRVVGDSHLADDAFQAVFLVLARRAASVRPREQLANFLFGVAYRTALKARAVQARRRAKETQVDPMPHPPVAPPDVWHDLQPVIDAELARLPDKLRLPVVLCDLEGRPQREVARQLGLPPATLANRLASARRTLSKRLTERGITLSGGALAATVTANAAKAVPPSLAVAAEQVAALAAGGALAGTVPAQVVQLSEGVMRMMMLAKLKSTAVSLVAVLAVVGGMMLGAVPVFADDPAATPTPATKTDPTKPGLGPNLTDEEFLKRMCLDLRGTPANPVEVAYFVADKDAAKRKKVVGWLTEPEQEGDAANAVRLWKLNKRNALVPQRQNLNTIQNALIYHYPQHPTDGGQWTNELQGNPYNVWQLGLTTTHDSDILTRWLIAGQDGTSNTLLAAGQPTVWEIYNPQTVDPAGQKYSVHWTTQQQQTDEQFLTKVCQDARGGAPTRIEREYFLADKDPKKREKLIDLMLKDPAVAKKVGPNWKQSLLNPPAQYYYRAVNRLATVNRAIRTSRMETLLVQLMDGKRTDDQVLDGLSAAVLGRLPTESERKLILANVAKAPDKATAWREVIGTLSGTDEARQHADALKARTTEKK